MGSLDTTDTVIDYEATKGRIGSALDTLRNQLMEMQQQDVVLLRQLMHIHTTIQTLNGSRRSGYGRSLSSTSLSSSWSGSFTMPRHHRALSRLQSAPLRQQSVPATEVEAEGTDDEDEDEDDDLMAQSFNSFSIDTPESSFNVRSSSLSLPPIPRSVRRKLFVPINESPEPMDENPHLKASPSSPEISEASDYRDSFLSEIVSSDNWPRIERKTALSQYEPSYQTMLKRSSQLWRDVQKEREEKGTVDQKKMATLKIFL